MRLEQLGLAHEDLHEGTDAEIALVNGTYFYIMIFSSMLASFILLWIILFGIFKYRGLWSNGISKQLVAITLVLWILNFLACVIWCLFRSDFWLNIKPIAKEDEKSNEMSYCKLVYIVNYCLYLLGKYVLHILLIYRIHVTFSNTMFQCNKRFLLVFGLAITLSELTCLVLWVYHTYSEVQLGQIAQHDIHVCIDTVDSVKSKIYVMLFGFQDFFISSLTLAIFLYKIRHVIMQSKDPLTVIIMRKLFILGTVAIFSTFIFYTIAKPFMDDVSYFIPLDCLINSVCILLVCEFSHTIYKYVCSCCDRTVAKVMDQMKLASLEEQELSNGTIVVGSYTRGHRSTVIYPKSQSMMTLRKNQSDRRPVRRYTATTPNTHARTIDLGSPISETMSTVTELTLSRADLKPKVNTHKLTDLLGETVELRDEADTDGHSNPRDTDTPSMVDRALDPKRSKQRVLSSSALNFEAKTPRKSPRKHFHEDSRTDMFRNKNRDIDRLKITTKSPHGDSLSIGTPYKEVNFAGIAVSPRVLGHRRKIRQVRAESTGTPVVRFRETHQVHMPRVHTPSEVPNPLLKYGKGLDEGLEKLRRYTKELEANLRKEQKQKQKTKKSKKNPGFFSKSLPNSPFMKRKPDFEFVVDHDVEEMEEENNFITVDVTRLQKRNVSCMPSDVQLVFRN